MGSLVTVLAKMNRSFRQKANEETLDLNHTSNQMNSTDLHRKLHAIAAEYILFTWNLH